PRHQLVELTAGREVLIFKTMRLAGPRGAERAANDHLINRRKQVARSRKEARDLREAVCDCARARRSQSQGRALARQTVQTFGPRAFAAHRPERVVKVLFDERYFYLHREFYV